MGICGKVRTKWELHLTNAKTRLTKCWNEPSSVSPKHEQSSEITADSEPAETSAMAKSAKAFKLRELETATKNFRLRLPSGSGRWWLDRVNKGHRENGRVYTIAP